MKGSSALIPALLRNGDPAAAARHATASLRETFGLDVTTVQFTQDEYSLNSVSGRARLSDGTAYFFKFHQEEGEEDNVAEYYRAHLLSDAGLPVEIPIAASSTPGAQMVLYPLRTEPRMADICADLERADGAAASLAPALLRAKRVMDARIGEVLLETLAPPAATSAGAAVHQLFYHRLVDPSGQFPGGRYLSYYADDPTFGAVAAKRWQVNGVEYELSPAELARRAVEQLHPSRLAELPVVTAHGDDHHGNVWALDGGTSGPVLRLFDPAFAATDIPALLAPVKATYHNALAHPFWLYHPAEAAERLTVESTVGADWVEISHDANLSRLREEVLASAAEFIWRPLLHEMAKRSWLPANWRQIVRSALFCCPMLVTNLVAERRPAQVRLLGLAQAVAAGSEPVNGQHDDISAFLDEVEP